MGYFELVCTEIQLSPIRPLMLQDDSLTLTDKT